MSGVRDLLSWPAHAGGDPPRDVMQARFFPPSPAVAIPFLFAGGFLILGGSPELALVLFLVGLFNCLYLTMLEFAGLLLAGNLVYAACRWWFPDTQTGLDTPGGLLIFNLLLLWGRYVVFRKLMFLSEGNHYLAEMAMVDGLTGTYNRHFLRDAGNRAYNSYQRAGTHFCIILLDIDHFKQINDKHGHAGGDVTLLWLAELLKSGLRLQDIAGRYGGDEFMIILPDSSLDDGLQTAQRLRNMIARPDEGSPAASRGLSVSLGLAQVEGTDKDFGSVVDHADDALYEAKHSGRDTIKSW